MTLILPQIGRWYKPLQGITLDAGTYFSIRWGFCRDGGTTSINSFSGSSWGSISSTILDGFITDYLSSDDVGDVTVILIEDAVSDLSGVSDLRINSELYPLSSGPTYQSNLNTTNMTFSAIQFVDGASYNVELIF